MSNLKAVLTANRRALVVGLLTGSLIFINAQKRTPFTPHERAFYADPALVAFVQPGLAINIVSAKVASDGTISVDYKLTDPTGAPLTDQASPHPGLSR